MKKVESGKEAGAEEQEGQEAPATEAALVPEILTISHDHNNPYQLQFDDPSWRRHLPSLKPLGVSVLLNTCNLETEEKYADFYHFLVTQSSCQGRRPELLPIPSRGCLCQLSQRLGLGGWHPPLVPEWRLVTQLQSYRPLASSDSAFTRNLSLARLKFPFPHQVSVVARESSGGRVSLLSQGTADIVLDSCQDAWTGHDLAPLSAAARKKCSEFYHRASLTAYCTTFAYKPLLPGAVCRGAEAGYIEIPSSLPISVQSKLRDLDNVSVSSLDGDLLHTQDSADVLTTLHSQSFLGMVQMQYQAMVDMVQFIDLLEKACIRFVHFSKENELRSKVFSEKMGLESGWNCHISLHSQADVEAAPGLMYGSRVPRSSNVDRSFGKNSSVPAKLNHDWRLCDIPQWTESSQPLLKGKLEEGAELSTAGSISSMLEYDMNNRAQLPAGIENIRPHLEQMDNVPLLVSLFTDCTPATTREMVRILQENCEVVAVLGSSANYHNMTIFLAADASIAVEPLYPQVCRKVDVMASCAGLAPTELARHMVSIGTSVSFKREETDVSVYRAIIRSRRHVLAIRHGLQLWTSCCLFLTSLVLASLLLLLPRFNRLKYFYCSVNILHPCRSPLSPPQMLVITSVYIPLLATASFFSAHDSNISNISTGKNKNTFLNRSTLWQSVWCYGMRFSMAFIAVFLSHLFSLLHLKSQCQPDTQCFDTIQEKLSFVTDANMTFLTFYLVCISFSFVSRTDHLWKYRLKRSWHIGLVALLIVVLQSLYFLLKCLEVNVEECLPLWSWIMLGGCIPVQVLVNELIRRHEIKVNVRFQRRARLDFNTKLGINSPF